MDVNKIKCLVGNYKLYKSLCKASCFDSYFTYILIILLDLMKVEDKVNRELYIRKTQTVMYKLHRYM